MAETAKKTTTRKTTQAPTAPEPAEVPAVFEAWSNVMNEAQSLAKAQRNTEGGNYMYRGIDDVMNLVGPLLRKHRVAVVPDVVSASYRDVQTSRGKPAREVTVRVQFTIYGPAGDTIVGSAPGEAMDNGDKGTAKAMSVAYRVFLLQSLTLPTNDRDPDADNFERGSGKTPEQMAQEVVDGMPDDITVQRLEGVKHWANQRALLDLMVRDKEGNGRTLLAFLDECLERAAMNDPQAQAKRQSQVDRALGRDEQPAEA